MFLIAAPIAANGRLFVGVAGLTHDRHRDDVTLVAVDVLRPDRDLLGPLEEIDPTQEGAVIVGRHGLVGGDGEAVGVDVLHRHAGVEDDVAPGGWRWWRRR